MLTAGKIPRDSGMCPRSAAGRAPDLFTVTGILAEQVGLEMKRALITGITGQDGAYLAEFLLRKGYEVHGIKRRASLFNIDRIDHLYQDPHSDARKFILHYGDMTDSSNLTRIVQEVRPDEIYNLAAQSHVQVSFEAPEYTADVDAPGALRLLEASRITGLTARTRFCQAPTSELFGLVREVPQTEKTPFCPRSPYACAKLHAYWITVNYREAYGICACNGILFNHESPDRGETFVTRKIRARFRGSCSASRIASISAIWMPGGTGGMPATMWKCSGSCCSRKSPRILSLPPGGNFPCAILSTPRRLNWASSSRGGERRG